MRGKYYLTADAGEPGQEPFWRQPRRQMEQPSGIEIAGETYVGIIG